MPPGWPVPHTLMRSSASAPRTSPTTTRSGRRRMDERTSSVIDTTPARVRRGTWSRAAHCSSTVSSSTSTRSPVAAISASSALARVVLPLLVAPAIKTFCRSRTARTRKPACALVIIPSMTYRSSGMTPMARLRSAKAGPGAAGGKMPSKRSPVSGNSADSSGWPRCTSAPTWAATRRMIRSPSASDSSTPIGARPLESRSTQRVRSGFSITSTTSGSSSAAAISGPIAVRSIWMRRSSDVALMDCGTALMTHAPALAPLPPRLPSASGRDAVPPPRRAPGCGPAAGGGQAAR
ncbi:hypothetical protein Q015_01410 [Pseudomonas aeruginosa BWHPSA002]|nr:hypothetical protein Q090_02303 [Pseudomonas aeruginosa C51]ERX09111.1 hypothetical protein Q015_01410 [Pseudomonas aeruginosa BWHPSA002]